MAPVIEVGVPAAAVSISRAVPADASATLELESLVPLGESVVYLWVRGPDREAAVDALVGAAGSEVSVLDRRSSSLLLRTAWSDTDWSLFERFERSDATLLSGECRGERWVFRLRFPDTEAVSTFYESCDAAGIEVTVLDIEQVADRRGGAATRLSPIQRETLRVAFDEGYFEVPRQTTIQELAAQLGVSEQSVSERLRRGLTALVDATVVAEARADEK